MKLILMRHAKSDWDDPTLADHDRTLNPRGQGDARLMGKWLAENGHTPDSILSSTATRTAETCRILCEELPGQPHVSFSAALYLSGPDKMLRTINKAGAGDLLVIAHNPGIAMLAEMLSAQPKPGGTFQTYPTAAITILEFSGNTWSSVGYGEGEFIDFATPKSLKT